MTIKDAMSHVPDGAKHAADAVSAVTVLGTLFSYLPSVAALFTLIWTIIRIYETDTVQSLIARYRKK